MQSYHRVWLAAHPERSAEWLLERLRDGFDVHHVDGDHSNDDPGNLVLIEMHDHFLMHGRPRGSMKRAKPKPRAAPKGGRDLYAAYLSGERSWRELGEARGMTAAEARQAAERYARAAGEAWPVRLPHAVRHARPSAVAKDDALTAKREAIRARLPALYEARSRLGSVAAALREAGIDRKQAPIATEMLKAHAAQQGLPWSFRSEGHQTISRHSVIKTRDELP